ncbi:CheR family methyltransferase [Streptomyces sp. N35]|uniref:CheR family methyltransferase n=1 Tax=Streptomyces sp. N35 TaxID=2795730 RepID=UPI0018F34FD0|nr:CheR family methyltransferase [Streptomyces sp. N35]
MADALDAGTGEEFEELLVFLRDARGFDFTGYKRSTLGRRVKRRMADAKVATYADYRDLLETNAGEFDTLFNTILINVTSVFRDPAAWTYVQSEVVPELLARGSGDSEIRVWSAGCSTGEEPYSLAIMFAEALGIEETAQRVKIYGTDVDEEALRVARSGLYSAKSLEPLPPELRDKYFEEQGDRFAFRTDLRRRVIFGRHDITRDAPISRLDLLVCRNTLMYFNIETQRQIVDRFHFALAEGGFLFLGKAEMLLNDSERYEAVSVRQRLFRRRPGDPSSRHPAVPVKLRDRAGTEQRSAAARTRQLRDLVLDALPTPTISVDQQGTVLLVNEQARNAFGLTQQDAGRPFHDLEISYRPVELRSLIEQARHEMRSLRVSGAERRNGSDTRFYDIHVQPLTDSAGQPVATTISFTDVTTAVHLKVENGRVREELETAYEELQSTNEELETTNEELQSTNEELETTNEELQSSIEELETTNEELQSSNSELETLNESMQTHTEAVNEATSFLEGVLTSIDAGVAMLDADFKVKSWNRGATELWGLRDDEAIGAPFFGLDFGLPVEQLRGAVERCLASGRRPAPVGIPAVNRLGRAVLCTVTCTPFGERRNGVVLFMEATETEGSG